MQWLSSGNSKPWQVTDMIKKEHAAKCQQLIHEMIYTTRNGMYM